MKILIVDNHVLLRKGIKCILEEMSVVQVVAEASNGHKAVEQARKERFDLILLDISKPGKDGIDTLNQLQYEHPDLRVLILSMHSEKQYAVRALKSGASGYLSKNCDPDELKQAVTDIMTKGKYISPAVAMVLADAINTTSRPSYESLSDRENQVMQLLVEAKTISEIAGELNISGKTVTTYKGRILEKLNLKNIVDLVRYAFENSLA